MDYLSLKTATVQEFQDIKPIWSKMSRSEQIWFNLLRRSCLVGSSQASLAIICPDKETFTKVCPGRIYESNRKQRNEESKATKRHSPYRIHDYLNQIGAGEREVIDYLDHKYHTEFVTYSNGKYGSEKVRTLFEHDENREYLDKMYEHQQTVTAPQNEAAAKDFHAYIEGLLERNRGIIERNEAVWQKSAEELEALIKAQTEDDTEVNTPKDRTFVPLNHNTPKQATPHDVRKYELLREQGCSHQEAMDAAQWGESKLESIQENLEQLYVKEIYNV
jgi:hypothetical protein